ncbi:hypothetical protein EMCRGX_G023936 [Ephydatia muelleri]
MASFLGPQRFEIIADREKFEKELTEVLHKALSAAETPPKEKHVRTALIATWREKGCTSFWKVLHQFPLTRSHVICWKACFVIHRALRDGHPEVSKKSTGHLHALGDIAKHWGRAVAGYSLLIAAYVKVLMTRIAFHIKNPQIASSLNFEDSPFQIPPDIDYVFQLAVEVFDLQSSILHLYAGISSSIDGVQPNQIECHLAPLIPSIQDSAALYDLIFKLMKTLHTTLPADTLTGHRDRFNRQYQALRKYFHEFGKIRYLQLLVKVPSLSPDPPSFLAPGQLTEESLAKQIQTFAPVEDNDQGDVTMSVTSSVVTSAMKVESTPPQPQPQQQPPADPFAAAFGGSSFESFSFTPPTKDEKDNLIEQLMREVIDLKEKISDLEGQHRADEELMTGLRERVQQLEMELADYKDIAEQTCSENVLLKKQLETQAQSAAQEASNAQTKMVEEKFAKLREVYQKLRTDHIQLLRENGETQKKLKAVDAQMEQREASAKALEAQVNTLSLQMEEARMQMKDDSHEVELVKEQLKRKEEESAELKQAHSNLKEQLRIKEEESVRLEQTHSVVREQLKKKEEESVQLGQAQSSLREQLKAKEEAATTSHNVLVRAVTNAEAVVQAAIEETGASKPTITSTPDYLLRQTAKTVDMVASTNAAFLACITNPASLPDAVAYVSALGHMVGGVVVHGVSISSATTTADDSHKLTQISHEVGSKALAYLALLKQSKPDMGAIEATGNQLKTSIQALSKLVESVVPVVVEEEPEEALGDMVEEEMASTSRAVEAAAQRNPGDAQEVQGGQQRGHIGSERVHLGILHGSDESDQGSH